MGAFGEFIQIQDGGQYRYLMTPDIALLQGVWCEFSSCGTVPLKNIMDTYYVDLVGMCFPYEEKSMLKILFCLCTWVVSIPDLIERLKPIADWIRSTILRIENNDNIGQPKKIFGDIFYYLSLIPSLEDIKEAKDISLHDFKIYISQIIRNFRNTSLKIHSQVGCNIL